MPVRLILIGLTAGFFSALFGVGGGIVIVPLLLLAGRWEMRSASATSLAAIGITATAGVITYLVHGQVEPAYAALVGVPAALGAVGGTALQQRLPVRTLSFLFAGLLVVIGVRMLLQ
ncbi:MAG TPA: sulfite exporter TauE/SafE family protein [Gaiellaceae bacterium]